MPKDPRQQVQDLQKNSLVPQASPQSVDSYLRPGEREVQRTNFANNPFNKLADSLSQIDPTLREAVNLGVREFTEDEIAHTKAAHLANREAFNAAIKRGELPPGASPWVRRAAQRLTLADMAGEYQSQVELDFHGEAGAEARSSNDPKVMTAFLNTTREKFKAKLNKEDGSPVFSELDLAEVFHPEVEKIDRAAMGLHAAHRVKESEKELETAASAGVMNAIERFTKTAEDDPYGINHERRKQEASETIRAVFDHPDRGAVRNGMPWDKANGIMRDALVAEAKRTGNREILEILGNIKTNSGASLGKTRESLAAVQAAEEHITDREIKVAHQKEWLALAPHRKLAAEVAEREWSRQDERFKVEMATKENVLTLERRALEGLDRPKDGVIITNEALHNLRQISPEAEQRVRGWIHSIQQRKTHEADDSLTMFNLYRDMRKNPAAFNEDRLFQQVKSGSLKGHTAVSMYHELDKLRITGAKFPQMSTPDFNEALHAVERSVYTDERKMMNMEQAAIDSSNAVGDLRDRTEVFLQGKPNASQAEVRMFLREQLPKTIEAFNADFHKAQDKIRAEKAAEKAQMERDVLSSVGGIVQDADAIERQRGLKRLQDIEAGGQRAFENRRQRDMIESSKTPMKDDRTSQFFSWIAGNGPSPFRSSASPAQSITPQDFSRLTTPVQREAILKAAPADRRGLLMQFIGPRFMEAGQSPQEMNEAIDTFLSRLK